MRGGLVIIPVLILASACTVDGSSDSPSPAKTGPVVSIPFPGPESPDAYTAKRKTCRSRAPEYPKMIARESGPDIDTTTTELSGGWVWSDKRKSCEATIDYVRFEAEPSHCWEIAALSDNPNYDLDTHPHLHNPILTSEPAGEDHTC